MFTHIQKWGNSQGIRLPKSILQAVGLKENDKVEIKIKDGGLFILPAKKHKTLEERIAESQGNYKCSEWDTGRPEGNEIW
ncbi:AbrB/MazE/SpoVT family DNA-binding domain-containing protein [Thermosyntropha sp.]|uniref:AbrB/MazE/SpoVT family DNA-binding domain-containing protein n=1 Tax=Thermosyntropha sp. TaxID=2740820 RepID=UPI0025CC9D36|nr:AbrB/MazE/SpoVT family DNA-binding domain-containing protein [Thermosyntropha sp.]MBO8159726.1 AbrB/MazE/SpoVT family DNA-binding domain-containing protein [Thermosyntropha sp.]